MAEKVARLGIVRDRDFMYYVADGAVWRVSRGTGQAKGASERVASLDIIEQDPHYIYFLDQDGDVSRARKGTRGQDAGDQSVQYLRVDDFVRDLAAWHEKEDVCPMVARVVGARYEQKREALAALTRALSDAATDDQQVALARTALTGLGHVRSWAEDLLGVSWNPVEEILKAYRSDAVDDKDGGLHMAFDEDEEDGCFDDEDSPGVDAEGGSGLTRGVVYPLPDPSVSMPVPAAYDHQLVTLRRLHQVVQDQPPVSGVVHLPTGAGKTRIAMEFIAHTLLDEPKHRFLWATYSKGLIGQTMEKAVEYARMMPRGTRMAWHHRDPELLAREDVHITFLTRDGLRKQLEHAHTRKAHPWRVRLQSGQPLTLIYDECHQLGADDLQTQLAKFYDKVVQAGHRAQRAWRVIGLSATPVPTRIEAQELLRDTVFPLRPGVPTPGLDWGMHVFHRVENAELIRAGVLCEVNMFWDRSGVFDIPADVLKRVVGEARLHPPGPQAGKDEVFQYAARFDKEVMGHDAIVRFLAERLARNLTSLGKTVVFTPSIKVANRLVELLAGYPECRSKVAAVHSKMAELRHAVPGQAERTPAEVLRRFKERESEPCILVNVEMLTEGFDDPKVRTIVLAKLTLSTNRFWQMVGRGTRGTKSGGTTDCFLIDPIKLTRLYDYFEGYQPAVGSKPGSAIGDEPEESGQEALDPAVPSVCRPPLPSAVPYQISAELRRTHAKVAAAIEAFLGGARLGEQEVIAIAHEASICAENGAVVVRPVEETPTPIAETGATVLFDMLARMQARMSADFAWLQRQLPGETSDDIIRFWVRKLNAIETLNIRTEEEYGRAEMDGRIARALAVPVVMADAATSAPVPAPTPPRPDTNTADVACLCATIARADGVVHPEEVEVAVRVVNRLTGTPDGAALHAMLAELAPTTEQSSAAAANLAAQLDEAQRKRLVRGLVDVAASDSFIHPAETEDIHRIAERFGISHDYVEALLDARET